METQSRSDGPDPGPDSGPGLDLDLPVTEQKTLRLRSKAGVCWFVKVMDRRLFEHKHFHLEQKMSRTGFS